MRTKKKKIKIKIKIKILKKKEKKKDLFPQTFISSWLKTSFLMLHDYAALRIPFLFLFLFFFWLIDSSYSKWFIKEFITESDLLG